MKKEYTAPNIQVTLMTQSDNIMVVSGITEPQSQFSKIKFSNLNS